LTDAEALVPDTDQDGLGQAASLPFRQDNGDFAVKLGATRMHERLAVDFASEVVVEGKLD
jgi:hypothetical protein